MPRLLTAAAAAGLSLSLIACTGSISSPDAHGACEGCAATDVPWSRNFGAPGLGGNGRIGGVAADDGVLALISVGQRHLRRFDPAGKPVWEKGIDNLRDVALDADGSVVVAFDIAAGAPSSILGEPVSCASDGCVGVARMGKNGAPVWVQTLGAHGAMAFVNIDTLQVAADGRIAVAGTFSGTLDLGTGPLDPDGDLLTNFVAALTADGVPVWSRAVHFHYPPGPGFKGFAVLDMAVSPGGDVLISGESEAPLDYGAGVVGLADGTHVGFFARYDQAGNVVHGGVLAANANYPITVAADAAGNAVLAAWISGTFDVGGGAMGTGDKDQLYLLRFDPTGQFLGGAPIAEGSIGDAWDDAPVDGTDQLLAVDGAGHVWLCGAVSGSLPVGGAPVQAVSKSDVLLLELDPAGNLLSQRQFGTSGSSSCDRIRLGPTGVPVISGWMDDSIDFGQGLLQAVGSGDLFIAKLGPAGH